MGFVDESGAGGAAPGAYATPADVAALQTQINDLDPSRPIGTFDPASFDENVLPAGEKHDYLRATADGEITLNGQTIEVRKGDRLRVGADGTDANTPANWSYIPMSPDAVNTAFGDAQVMVVSPVAEAGRQHITVNNTNGNQFGISNYLFHLSDDPAIVGSLAGKTVTLKKGVAKDFYLVGPSTEGAPANGDFQHNGTVNGVHFKATFDGSTLNYEVVEVIRDHPGPGDYATRSYASVSAAQDSANSPITDPAWEGRANFDLLFNGFSVYSAVPIPVDKDVLIMRQDVTTAAGLFTDAELIADVNAGSANPASELKYRDLTLITDEFRDADGLVTYKLVYEDTNVDADVVAVFSMASDLTDPGATGVNIISNTLTTTQFIGLSAGSSGNASFAGFSGNGWWWAIGVKTLHNGAIPVNQIGGVIANKASLYLVPLTAEQKAQKAAVEYIDKLASVIYEVEADMRNSGGQPAGNGLFVIQNQKVNVPNGHIEFDVAQNAWKITAPDNYDLTVSTLDYETTSITGTATRSYHFRDITQSAATVLGTSGEFGQGSAHTPANFVLPKGQSITVDIRSVSSGNNQVLAAKAKVIATVPASKEQLHSVPLQYRTDSVTTHVVDGLMVDAAPAWTDEQSIAHGTTEVVSTGVNLDDVEKLIVHFERTNGTWPTSKIVDVSKIKLGIVQGAMMVHFDGTYLGIRNMTSAQKTAGDIPFFAFGIAGQFGFHVTEIEFKKRANGVSRRLGENVFIKSARFADDASAIAQGFLPAKPGIVENGAIDYPQWAAIYTEFVSGNDIVFPADVAGIFLRNAGGNADAEGVHQSYATALPTDPFQVADTANRVNRNTGGSGTGVAGTAESNVTKNITGGDVETRPENYSYQWYCIVDTYVEAVTARPVPATFEVLNVAPSFVTTPTFQNIGDANVDITGSDGATVYFEYGDDARDSFVFLGGKAEAERKGYNTYDIEIQVLSGQLQVRHTSTNGSGISRVWYRP